MDTAMSALHQGNIGIRVFQETKLTGGIHTGYSSGYKLWATEAVRRHRGGIDIVWREEEGWQVEVTRNFGMNVVSFTFTLVWKFWYIVGAYLTPKDQPAIHRVAQTLACELVGVGTLLVGKLNARLEQLRDQQEEDLEIIIASHGLSD